MQGKDYENQVAAAQANEARRAESGASRASSRLPRKNTISQAANDNMNLQPADAVPNSASRLAVCSIPRAMRSTTRSPISAVLPERVSCSQQGQTNPSRAPDNPVAQPRPRRPADDSASRQCRDEPPATDELERCRRPPRCDRSNAATRPGADQAGRTYPAMPRAARSRAASWRASAEEGQAGQYGEADRGRQAGGRQQQPPQVPRAECRRATPSPVLVSATRTRTSRMAASRRSGSRGDQAPRRAS